MRAQPIIASTLAITLVACGAASTRPAAPAPVAPLAAVVPDGFDLALVWRSESVGPAPTPHPRLRVDPSGRAFALVDDVFVPLTSPSGTVAKPIRLRNIAIGDYAWADDGMLLVVVDRALHRVTPAGLDRLAELPARGMHVATATADRCWLFGGEGDSAGAIFLYDQRAGLHSVLQFPKPVRAITGTPARAHVATEGSILRIALGSPMELVYDGEDEIVALADAADGGVFFSTKRGVFYLSSDRRLLHLMNERASDLQSTTNELYMVFDDVGIARGAPLSAFRNPTQETRR